jgi:hypothetical protein
LPPREIRFPEDRIDDMGVIGTIFVVLALLSVALAMSPISCVASVRGKKFNIEADTVEEFSQKVEEVSGLVASEQSVLFRGKLLEPSNKLEDLGISNGDILNVLKGRKARAPKAQLPKSMTMGLDGSASSRAKNAGGLTGMSDGMSPEEMMKNMDPEKIKQTMEAMERMLDSDVIEQYFGDDEKIEQARVQMLASVDQYEQMMPGFKEQAQEVASDPEKWRQAMSSAKEQILKLKSLRAMQKAASSLPE